MEMCCGCGGGCTSGCDENLLPSQCVDTNIAADGTVLTDNHGDACA